MKTVVTTSAIDSSRFGCTVAKCTVDAATTVADLLSACAEGKVRLLIARCPSLLVSQIQRLEAADFFIADTLVYYTNAVLAAPPADARDVIVVRQSSADDAVAVKDVAAKAFEGYYGHYHADARLSRAACDAVYADWAYNSCVDAQYADTVLLAQEEDNVAILAFITLKARSADLLEIVLNAVDPAHQGRGLYARLVAEAKRWAVAKGFSRLTVSTQLPNIAVQKVWCRQGFEPSQSLYTLHRWFD